MEIKAIVTCEKMAHYPRYTTCVSKIVFAVIIM